MRILAFDLETVPDLVMGARCYGINAEGPEPYEHLAAARLAETEGKSDMLKTFAQRIVGLGMVGIDTDTGEVKIDAHAGPYEAKMLGAFHAWLSGSPVIVGWNTLGFDFPVLRYRALYHGIPLPRLYGPANQRSYDKYDYRFGDNHYDLCDVLSGYGRSTSLKLSEAAALCGFPCKTDGDGSDVLAHFQAGDFDWIRTYVGDDARTTARIFLRWQMSRGRLDPKMMLRLDEQLERNDVGVVPAPEPALALESVP